MKAPNDDTYDEAWAEQAEEKFEAAAERIAAKRRKGQTHSSVSTTEFRADDLWNANFPEIEYVVPGVIAPGLTLLCGAPKLGKSWLALDFAQAVSAGNETLGGRQCQRGDVLYAALEDNPRRLKSRLHKVCVSKPGPNLTFWTEMAAVDSGGTDALRRWLTSANNPRMIIIDVLNLVRPEPKGNESAYTFDYRSATPFKALADEFGIAIVLIHHTRKAEAADWLSTVSGTHGLTGAADTTVALVRDGHGVTLYARGRDIPELELAVQFDGKSCRWRELGDAGMVRISDGRKAVVEALTGASHPMSPKELSKLTKCKPGAMRVMLGEMVKSGQLIKFGRGEYSLPPANFTNNLTSDLAPDADS